MPLQSRTWSVNTGRRLDALDEIVADEQQMAAVLRRGAESAETQTALTAICSHVDQIYQKIGVISQKVNNNPVGQTGLASGEVELF